jgi:hypothetical protein
LKLAIQIVAGSDGMRIGRSAVVGLLLIEFLGEVGDASVVLGDPPVLRDLLAGLVDHSADQLLGVEIDLFGVREEDRHLGIVGDDQHVVVGHEVVLLDLDFSLLAAVLIDDLDVEMDPAAATAAEWWCQGHWRKPALQREVVVRRGEAR